MVETERNVLKANLKIELLFYFYATRSAQRTDMTVGLAVRKLVYSSINSGSTWLTDPQAII